MDKLKIMLDCNAFDKFLAFLKQDNRNFEKLIGQLEIYVNPVQLGEIENIKKSDAGKHSQIMEMVKEYRIGDNTGGYFGFYGSDGSPFGQACFQSEDSRSYEESIEKHLDKTKPPTQKRNNKPDAYLATVARDYGCIVITNDGSGRKKGLKQAIEEKEGQVLSFEELLEKLGL